VRPEHQQVVAAKVDDERNDSDHPELEHLADEDAKCSAGTSYQRKSICGHKTRVTAETGLW
jgi:hypothetical protein